MTPEEINKKAEEAFPDGIFVGLSYALGIIDEVEKEHPAPSDIQKAAHKAYPVDMLGDVHHPRLMIDRNQTKREAFIEGMLAERERIAALPTIKGWAARDEDGSLTFFYDSTGRGGKPTRSKYTPRWDMNHTDWFSLDTNFFPDLKWEDEPIEVELPIIRK